MCGLRFHLPPYAGKVTWDCFRMDYERTSDPDLGDGQRFSFTFISREHTSARCFADKMG